MRRYKTLDNLAREPLKNKDYLSYIQYFPIILYSKIFSNRIISQLKRSQKVPDFNVVAQNFSMNMECMNAICAEKKIKFYSVLQPFNGIGIRDLTDNDRLLLKIIKMQKIYQEKTRFDFILGYYADLVEKMQNLPFFHDYSGVFDKEKGQIFFDTVHFSDKGQEIIADTLCNMILKGEKK